MILRRQAPRNVVGPQECDSIARLQRDQLLDARLWAERNQLRQQEASDALAREYAARTARQKAILIRAQQLVVPEQVVVERLQYLGY